MLWRIYFLWKSLVFSPSGKKKPHRTNPWGLVAPPTGLEPVTPWLTVRCSTDWAMEDYEILHKFDALDLFVFPSIAPWYVPCSHYRLSYGGIWNSKANSPLCFRKQTEVKRFRLTSVVSCWRIPIFPGRLQPSIFGTTELNFCVRNGNRWTLCVNLTNSASMCYHRLLYHTSFTLSSLNLSSLHLICYTWTSWIS